MAVVGSDIRVFQDPEALSQAAAVVFVETANQAIAERGQFRVALSGGKTPERLYALLAETPYRELIDWHRLHAFWGDERCVPPEDLDSNYRRTRDILLSRVPVPLENIRRVRTELDPELAAEDYALVLRKSADPPLEWPRFDLVLLGLGEDGHTASLFPGSPVATTRATLAVNMRGQNRQSWRVTMTPAVFNSGRRVVFLVLGAGKSKVVASVLYGATQPDRLPAQRIHPEAGELIWMLDAGAAANS
ncbi:MAG: 6-phosphogluconolactonase [Chloroflexota bacterium]